MDEDHLREHVALADRMARLIAPDDDRRALVAFTTLMNTVSGSWGPVWSRSAGAQRSGTRLNRHPAAFSLTLCSAPMRAG